MQEAMADRKFSVGGDALEILKAKLKQEEKSLGQAISKSLVTRPCFKERMQRKQFCIDAVSGNSELFEVLSDLLPAGQGSGVNH